jgi:hypothetical protein
VHDGVTQIVERAPAGIDLLQALAHGVCRVFDVGLRRFDPGAGALHAQRPQPAQLLRLVRLRQHAAHRHPRSRRAGRAAATPAPATARATLRKAGTFALMP